MEKHLMLHYLRNPYGADELELRKVHLKAADELERLYRMEEKTKVLINKIENFLTDKSMEA